MKDRGAAVDQRLQICTVVSRQLVSAKIDLVHFAQALVGNQRSNVSDQIRVQQEPRQVGKVLHNADVADAIVGQDRPIG